MKSRYVIFGENIETQALDQFYSAMDLDTVVQGALMPDAHAGYALPIGAVVATQDIIYPSWVGYDIGCGMTACKIKYRDGISSVYYNAEFIHQSILEAVPVGFKMHNKQQECDLDVNNLSSIGKKAFFNRGKFNALGTLGGGNHFIEIGYGEDDNIYVIIHSGSRGIGHGIATEYMRLASPDGKVREGHYGFDTNSDLGLSYINDMSWALEFALLNRLKILDEVVDAIGADADNDVINRNHNHAIYKDGLWIHRKGATHAEEGMHGVIPGNMRDGSFIVIGRGNPSSLCSSSHGAGRVMSRTQAKRKLSLEKMHKDMADESIVYTQGEKFLDEAPDAYKNIFDVMKLQKDLVTVIERVRPIVNVKG